MREYFSSDEYCKAENEFIEKMQQAGPLTLAEEALLGLAFAFGCNFALTKVRNYVEHTDNSGN